MANRGYIVPLLPEEFDALYNESVQRVDRDVYLFIRNWLDRDSAIAGLKSRISYRGIYERIYQAPRAGFAGDDFGSNPANYVRNCVRRMIHKGWLINRSKGKRLALEYKIFADYRDLYSFARKKVTSNLPPKVTSSSDVTNHCNNSNLPINNCSEIGGLTSKLPQRLTTYPEYPYIHTPTNNSSLKDYCNNHANVADKIKEFVTYFAQRRWAYAMGTKSMQAYQAWAELGITLDFVSVVTQEGLDQAKKDGVSISSPAYFHQVVIRRHQEKENETTRPQNYRRFGQSAIERNLEKLKQCGGVVDWED